MTLSPTTHWRVNPSIVALFAAGAFAPSNGSRAAEIRGAPEVHADAPDPGHRQQQDGALGVTSRARAPKRLAGDVTVGLQTGARGLSSAPNGDISGRLGLGWGLVAGVDVAKSPDGAQDYRPGASVLWQFAGRDGGPVSVAVGASFRAEGFIEPEGEAEGIFAATVRQGAAELSLNAVGGAEPDGREGDVEGALALGYWLLPALLVGAEGRERAGFGTKAGGFGDRRGDFAAAMAQARVRQFLLTGLVGARHDQEAGMGRTSFAALLRVGCGF